MCSDAPNRVFGTLRSDPAKITLVVQLLTEGMGIRGASRITGCHRDTIQRILKHAGKRCHELLQKKLVDVPVKHVQADEIWTYVLKKSEKDTNPEFDFNPWGDFYIFLGLESESKLLLMPTIGKRSKRHTEDFAADMNKATTGRFQLTTDGFRPYKKAMKNAMGDRIDFAQFYKEYNMLNTKKKDPIPNKALKDSANLLVVRCGNPDKSRVTTSHVERVNLTLRHFNKRFNRKTIGFSKDEECLAYSVYLFVAHTNFCRNHSALKIKANENQKAVERTPAQAAGLADARWSITQLLSKY